MFTKITFFLRLKRKKDFSVSCLCFPCPSCLSGPFLPYVSHLLHLRVTYAVPVLEGDPYFTIKLQDYTAVEKDEVVLDCELSKDVDVTWYHNEEELKPSNMVTIKADGKRRTLTIKKVKDQDKGQYVCDCGTDKTTAALHIEGKDTDLEVMRKHPSSGLHREHLLISHHIPSNSLLHFLC